jgi:cell division protease FtsH
MATRPTVLRFLLGALPLFLLWLVVFWLGRDKLGDSPRSVSYTEMLAAVRDGKAEEAEILPDRVTLRLQHEATKPAPVIQAMRIPNVDEAALVKELTERGVKVTGKSDTGSWWGPALLNLVPFLLIPGFLWLAGRTMTSPKNQPISFGRSRAKIYDRSKENPVTFADVAGVDEAKGELIEVVHFLKEPDKYRAIGARVPKGVLLVGAPGTGKTLLAKAVAGESRVPFFSMSGSEFVEMFVGVGASRVRDLFDQAKGRAPCIIFIDELDAIGKARAGAVGFAANEEREQTLNQLLVEMDGFDSGSGLVIMAATNRPEILDKALLRAGRFDRQVLVDRPDVRGREAILKVHARRVNLGANVDLRLIAQRTPGMVGADLANVVNEAALSSVRRGSQRVDAGDFEEAIDRIQLGLKKEGRVMTDAEKRRVAFHEGGHSLVALSLKNADPVHKVTIIPRSVGALGATLQLPVAERYLLTREELRDRICVLLGGRAAEELACDDVSTGAQDDLERATEMARHMICRFGMNDVLGPMTFGRAPQSAFLALTDSSEARNFSEETARTIDAEVKALMEAEHQRALRLLRERRSALDAIAGELMARETLQRSELAEIVARSAKPPFVAVA